MAKGLVLTRYGSLIVGYGFYDSGAAHATALGGRTGGRNYPVTVIS